MIHPTLKLTYLSTFLNPAHDTEDTSDICIYEQKQEHPSINLVIPSE